MKKLDNAKNVKKIFTKILLENVLNVIGIKILVLKIVLWLKEMVQLVRTKMTEIVLK